MERKWPDIVRLMPLPKTCTNAGFSLKLVYQKYLLDFERVHEYGLPDITPPLMDSRAACRFPSTCQRMSRFQTPFWVRRGRTSASAKQMPKKKRGRWRSCQQAAPAATPLKVSRSNTNVSGLGASSSAALPASAAARVAATRATIAPDHCACRWLGQRQYGGATGGSSSSCVHSSASS